MPNCAAFNISRSLSFWHFCNETQMMKCLLSEMNFSFSWKVKYWEQFATNDPYISISVLHLLSASTIISAPCWMSEFIGFSRFLWMTPTLPINSSFSSFYIELRLSFHRDNFLKVCFQVLNFLMRNKFGTFVNITLS